MADNHTKHEGWEWKRGKRIQALQVPFKLARSTMVERAHLFMSGALAGGEKNNGFFSPGINEPKLFEYVCFAWKRIGQKIPTFP